MSPGLAALSDLAAGGLEDLRLDPKEGLEARLFSLGDLPEGMPDAHWDLTAGLWTSGKSPMLRGRFVPSMLASWPR